ncbi:MAG: PIN domain-containing protein [Acidobacteria bacterium]|nr:MAG: PIN domain-containing protein [Acidobacteriota bacterium]
MVRPRARRKVIAIDTNLLVYAAGQTSPQHEAAQAAIEQARSHPEGWGVPFPVIAEFWSVITGRSAGARPATPAEAAWILADLGAAGAQLWFPTPGTESALRDLARKLDVRGARIFDLQIALIARENGARELWTHDAGFMPIPGLRLRDPL